MLNSSKDKSYELFTDSAYDSAESREVAESFGLKSKTHEKSYRNKPLTNKQKTSNKEKLKARAKVEHVFGFMEIV